MPNNFRITGNIYVSKAGNDANAGTSPDAPKRTIASAFAVVTGGSTIVVGAGQYSENITRTTNGLVNIYADGEVILTSQSNSINTITFTGALSVARITRWYNFKFVNYRIDPSNAPNTSDPALNVLFENCKFINTSIILQSNVYSSFYTINNCQFINSSIDFTLAGTVAPLQLTNSIIINSSLIFSTNSSQNAMQNCYIDPNSNVKILTSGTNATYNNIQGYLISAFASTVTSSVIQDTFSRYYDLALAGTGGSGTLGDPYYRNNTANSPFYYSNYVIAYPKYSTGSFSADPKFNSIEDQDFTLQSTSPHIRKAADSINNIGGTKYALRRTSRISFSGSQAAVDPSLIFQYDNYIISGSQVTGSITSAPIAVNTSVPKVIQKVTYNGLLAFNKDTGSASGSNQNVPDFDTFTSASGNAGANPDRLVYYMRHTTGSSIPVTDAGWENGGLWTAGQYNVFEWNTKPSIDNNGVGNGSGSFNAAVTPTFIQATYVQMQVKLRNDYLL